MPQNKVLPGSTIGIIGGGQLGRMMATAAKHLGYRIAVLDPTPNCPTAQVADEQIVAAYDDLEAVGQLADTSDVITYEFENVDLEAARLLETKGMLPQGADLLRITQDREQEKRMMAENELPISPFAIVHNQEELQQAIQQKIELPVVVKTCRGGYDGKGQFKIENETDIEGASEFVMKNKRCIVEKWVPFEKEISVIFTRSQNGEISLFPVAENEHKDHVLHQTIAPAQISETVKQKAIAAARTVAEGINVVGTFAIEMFVQREEIYLNEMAPRPHNSGHYTIEACNVSQFEQHIRAVCGLPLLPVYFHGAAIMLNLLGDDVDYYTNNLDVVSSAHVHVYGKGEVKPKRKMGHLTFVGTQIQQLQQLVTQQTKQHITS
ncbi:5-(carboxyamino)imidazole ribonucleotide synthase [Aquibacillus sediminis]|uniref:5-(carboxyamino)imidazole ribonucleotide synthase n=1 Tax=Aquibacillus sediminis TaxID=2574734 RepID=UPI001108C5CA|nr:5-(carboxyamino)imidazole ribonucleotide synthase [Aquibacillus sediminis]